MFIACACGGILEAIVVGCVLFLLGMCAIITGVTRSLKCSFSRVFRGKACCERNEKK